MATCYGDVCKNLHTYEVDFIKMEVLDIASLRMTLESKTKVRKLKVKSINHPRSGYFVRIFDQTEAFIAKALLEGKGVLFRSRKERPA